MVHKFSVRNTQPSIGLTWALPRDMHFSKKNSQMIPLSLQFSRSSFERKHFDEPVSSSSVHMRMRRGETHTAKIYKETKI